MPMCSSGLNEFRRISFRKCMRMLIVCCFRSLHDSGGNVVLESLAFGLARNLPDLGGPRHWWMRMCDCRGDNPDAQKGMSCCIGADLANMAANDSQRIAMSRAALKRANDMVWEKKGYGKQMSIIEGHCFRPIFLAKKISC